MFKITPSDKLFADVTTSTLATQLDSTPSVDVPLAQVEVRRGPPAATGLVHTDDDL